MSLLFPKSTNSRVLKQIRSTILLSSVASFFIFFSATGQNLKGQWIGNFNSAVGTDPANKTDYIIEIENTSDKISGYSYTYFAIAGKRFYVICRLEGTYDKGSKSLVVNEVETLKTNTPPDFQNCLQSHQLTYFKKNDKEVLIGKWKPTKVGSDCGKGITELERKLIARLPEAKSKSENAVAKKIEPIEKKIIQPAPAISNRESGKIKESPKTLTDNELKEASNYAESNDVKEDNTNDKKASNQQEYLRKNGMLNKEQEKLVIRVKQFIKTIDVTGKSFHIDIYDNGQVDGDTVTIFLNNKLLIPSKKLTTSPISLDIKIEDNIDTYDVTMFAETLGTIPPNTALMIVTTSTDRYEINITSTEQTSGAVRFKVKR